MASRMPSEECKGWPTVLVVCRLPVLGKFEPQGWQ